ncbi:prenyltransferase/squalene oxidase repeat-containing protein [Streptomyces sp. RPT161]|uniref:prenyltransferase/squalene oxidase repeat-containing protein n=1 Tax=Streptomyces sp. RPT161 TaxID=3015993 RepID=UPI0022B8CFBC|nr:prenyltransferase/squalene oxidase repeat-containing protein [Streptomyces sp. RPT161]
MAPSRRPRPAALARCAAALAAVALLGAAAPSPSTSSLPVGLYGGADPTYNGVWRQSTALLALSTVKVTPAKEAVDWLVGQQCADGGFATYRANPDTSCAPKTEDTNSTAVAVQALAAVGGHGTTVSKAVHWLKSMQNSDGGWGYQPGTPSDANSTAVVIGALTAPGEDVASVTRGGKSPYDALLSFQIGCGTKGAQDAQRGAFAYQPDKSGTLAPNDKATADAAFAALGKGYVIGAPAKNTDPKGFDCSAAQKANDPATAADAASAYLATTLSANGDHLTTAQPGSTQKTPDYGTTADAVLALASGNHLEAAKKPYTWLTKNAAGWAKGDPAALGSLILASAATGASPHDFAGNDLVQQLVNTGPRPEESTSPSASEDHKDSGGGGASAWWIVGAGLVAGIGIGWAFSMRNKKQV